MKIRKALARKARRTLASAAAVVLIAGAAFAQTPAPASPPKPDDKSARETELHGVEDTIRASEEQRRKIEADVEALKADRARLTAALIETTAKVQDNERQ
jgi:murein hydrolase activator